MILIQILIFLLGLALVLATTISAIRTLVLPRSSRDLLTNLVFRFWRWIFDLRLRRVHSYEERDRVMAFYAPVALLTLLPMWLLLVSLGFAAMFWGTGVATWQEALTISGSSLLTLGFAKSDSLLHIGMDFTEAALGLILIALLIAYLPIMYSAFSRRELAVTMLEVRAGSPPSAIEMISRYHRLNRLELLHDTWESWEAWFAEVEESHTSLAALVFFRSPQAKHSWVTASGAVLDAASLTLAAVDIPHDRQADLCIRAGYLALRHIADFFQVDHNPTPQFPQDPISIAREEFESAYDQLEMAGVPMKADREQAWLDFAGWRVNYDRVLISLCRLTMAPYAAWSSDRSLIGG
jgi:hypothetical protein